MTPPRTTSRRGRKFAVVTATQGAVLSWKRADEQRHADEHRGTEDERRPEPLTANGGRPLLVGLPASTRQDKMREDGIDEADDNEHAD